MQETSDLYKQILVSGNYKFETSVQIGDYVYGEDVLISVGTSKQVFANDVPQVGCCTCGEIDLEMHMPDEQIPRMAQVIPRVRLVSLEDPDLFSEWLQKGVYYIDTRENTHNNDQLNILTLHGFDTMMKANKVYTDPAIEYPAKDIDVVNDIARKLGVQVDQRSVPYINKGYEVQVPIQYTMREILGYIGAMYAGNWIFNDKGQLQLILLNDLPPETSLLIDEHAFYITFGEEPEEVCRIKLREETEDG